MKEKRPDIVFLVETKLLAKKFEGIKEGWSGKVVLLLSLWEGKGDWCLCEKVK